MVNSIKSRQWWRWLLLPIASLIGFILATILAFAFLKSAMWFQGGYSEDSTWALYIMPTIISAIGGYVYAYIAYNMAPTKKFTACATMIAILVIVSIAGIFTAWTKPIDEPIQITFGMIAESIASIVFLIKSR